MRKVIYMYLCNVWKNDGQIGKFWVQAILQILDLNVPKYKIL